MPADHRWNNSSLSLLQRCGEAYRRRYVEGEAFPPSPRMLRGTIVHRVARTTFQRKLARRALPSIEEARDLAATAFTAEAERGVLFSADDLAAGQQVVLARAKDFAVDLAAFHVAIVAPTITPLAVERQIVVRPRDSDLEIHGTLDLIARAPSPGHVPVGASAAGVGEIGGHEGDESVTVPGPRVGEEIRDLKTTEKSPSRDAADRSQQLTYYAMIRMAERGLLPDRLALDYLVRTPARAETKYVPLLTGRDAEDIAALVRRINLAVEAVGRGVFVPADPMAWWCAAEWCEYYPTCPYVRRGARPTA